MRSFALLLTVAAVLVPGSRLWASAADAIISEPLAERHGLTRPWLTQLQIDHGRGRVVDMVLHDGTLYLQTDRATLSAIDAETGHQLWSRIVGRPEHPSMTPCANDDFVATVNGSRLYVCNRYNGDLLYETQLDSGPSGGPALSAKFAYVPMAIGTVMAYRMEPLTDPEKELGKIKKDMTPEEKAAAEQDRRDNLRLRQEYIPPLACKSAGRPVSQPMVLTQNREEEFVVWPTDRGFLSLARIDRRDPSALIVKYELKADAAIAARVAYLPPDPKVRGDQGVVYAASRDGYVYAMLEKSGELLWKFPTGEPVLESPAVVDNRVYVPTQLGGMFCIDAKSGKQCWWAPEIVRFLAASKHRVYGADRGGRTQVLDAKGGARLDILPTELSAVKLANTETDRIYLATDTGLVQCLHEIELSQPIPYAESRKPAKEEEPKKPKLGAKKPAAEEDQGEKPKPKAKPKATPKPKPAKEKAAKALKGGAKKTKEDAEAPAGNGLLGGAGG